MLVTQELHLQEKKEGCGLPGLTVHLSKQWGSEHTQNSLLKAGL